MTTNQQTTCSQISRENLREQDAALNKESSAILEKMREANRSGTQDEWLKLKEEHEKVMARIDALHGWTPEMYAQAAAEVNKDYQREIQQQKNLAMHKAP